jgi:O-succinylbenzoate synthase
MPPSRLVPLVDDLEHRGLVRRERSRTDRRVNTLQLTPDGQAMLQTVRSVVQAHQASLLAAISDAERATLTTLLTRIADEQGLAPGVHPGYRTLGLDVAPATVTRQTAHDSAPSPTSTSS